MKYESWNVASRNPEGERRLHAAGLSPLSAVVLAARGITEPKAALALMNLGVWQLHDPMLLRDMDKAVLRLRQALISGERIAVYGDYDVDGITAACLLTDYLRSQGGDVLIYIPDRFREGYSLNFAALDNLCSRGVSLVVTVDCGTTSAAEADYAAQLGMEMIITDHHECKTGLPRALAVVNPCRPDCDYPFPKLAGVGVALKLVLAMSGEEQAPHVLQIYADLAAIGTVADVMELTGENRVIVSQGLEALRSPQRPGIAALMEKCGLMDKPVTASTVSFGLAPRLNAAGRMGRPDVAVQLLTVQSISQAAGLAQTLCALNRARQMIEQEIYTQCLQQLEERPDLRRNVIVLAGEGWHQGVIGIVANRLSEKYGVPAFIICLEGERGKGSCRASGNFNLFEALETCRDLLLDFGGHALAAGFTLRRENIDAFQHRMVQLARKQKRRETLPLLVDAELWENALMTQDNVERLDELEPFGMGNPRPVFLLRGMTVTRLASVGGGRHTRLTLSRDGLTLDAICFYGSPQELGVRRNSRIDVAGQLCVNKYRGNRNVQLQVQDIRPALSTEDWDRQAYRRWREGAVLTPPELQLLIPERPDFAAIWRYLAEVGRTDNTPVNFSREVALARGRNIPYSRTMVCLEVFQERGLIWLQANQDGLQIETKTVVGKVDLERSSVMLRLRQMAAEFETDDRAEE